MNKNDDHLEPMIRMSFAKKPGLVRVFARMHVLAANEGGRKHPVHGGYRPDHFFGELRDGAFVGRIDIPEGDVINLGETRNVWITFVDSQGLDAHLWPGNRWKINEAANPVATAEILKVEK